MNYKILTLLFWLLAGVGTASSQNRAAGAIAPKLLERANATVRDESIRVDLQSLTNMSVRISRTVTVHNRNGDEHGAISVYYDKSRKIQRINGEIMDEHGQTVGKFSMRDFQDSSASGASNLYDDSRVKRYQPVVHHYPYTISYEIEIRDKQSLLVPHWAPDYRYDISVERSSYTITVPSAQHLRIHEKNYGGDRTETEDAKTKSYTWALSDRAAQRSEPLSPPRDNEATVVRVVPESFQYYKKKGRIANWQDYGKWMYDELLADKKDLPASALAHARALTADASTPREKAEILYRYLQQKTRYISIQIGIGDLEPFPASAVEQLGYGDCKALVIYMQNLLEAVGIPSYYCIVEAGPIKRDITAGFANISDGNHVILCIPFENDTTWLECTSQLLPFGYLGDFTDDRTVVACTPAGGKLLRTPRFDHAESLQYREAHLRIEADGSVTGSMETLFKGNQLDNHYSNAYQSRQEQNRNLMRWYNVNGISFDAIGYKTTNGDTLGVNESLELTIRDYVVHADGFAILRPNIFNTTDAIPATRNRVKEVYINRGFTDVDVLHFALPEGYSKNLPPISHTVETPMATYELQITVENGVLTSRRMLQLREGRYPPDSYQALHDAMATIRANDLVRINIPTEAKAMPAAGDYKQEGIE